jgi:hypothetical protein
MNNINLLPFKKVITITILYFLHQLAFSQDNKHEKWHYYADYSGKQVIKVSAKSVNNFSDGMARVEKYFWDGGAKAFFNFGYIDTTGNLVIKQDFEKASDFKFGIASVKKRGEDFFYIIDKSGKKIIEKKLPVAPLIQENTIIWRENKSFGIMDFQGNILVPVGKYVDFGGYDDYGLCCVAKEKDPNTWLYGFIDTKGNEVIPCTYNQGGTSVFHGGLARVRMSNGKTGFIDTKGKIAIPGIYSTAASFSKGFYPAAFGKNRTLWGLVDSTNKTIIQGKYDDLRTPYNGTIRAELKGKHGYLKTDGSVLIPIEFDDWSFEISKVDLAVLVKNDIYYVFDINGKLIHQFKEGERVINVVPEYQTIIFRDNASGRTKMMNYEGKIIFENEKVCHIGSINNNRAMIIYCD